MCVIQTLCQKDVCVCELRFNYCTYQLCDHGKFLNLPLSVTWLKLGSILIIFQEVLNDN